MAIDREFLRELRKDIDAALNVVAAKHNIKLDTGNCSYTADTFTFKVEGSAAAGGLNKMEVDYNTYRTMYGLPELGTTVNLYGGPHKIIGWKGRSVIVESQRGAKYRVRPGYVKV